MIAFIITNLLLAALVQTHTPWLTLLATPGALGIGCVAMLISLLAGYLKKRPTLVWHDGFATSGLLIWFAYWKPLFNDDAPMFFLYPLYFALITLFVTLTLINKSADFDLESVKSLRYLDKIIRFDINTSIIFVLISLVITRHYALYPIAITFFVLRHTITVCLENIDS